MKRLFLPLTIAVTAGLLWASVTPAHACSCAVRPVSERVDFYSHVVVGSVLRLTDDLGNEFPDKDAVVSVERYLKGLGSRDIVVGDPVGDADCGFFGEASVGERYVLFLSNDDIFGKGDDASLHTHLCAGNELASDAFVAEVEAITGAGVVPTGDGPYHGPFVPPDDSEPLSEEADSGGFPYFPAAIAAVLGPLAFVLGASFVWRRRGA